MAINSYFGFAYKQNKNSPELFAFVGSADELKKICGVARKDEHHLTNYQRALDKDRLDKEVIPFFRSPTNCSPTAIVISLQETPICKIKYEDYIPAGTSEKLPFPLRKLTIDYINPKKCRAKR